MNYRMIGRINALLLLVEAIFMIPAMLTCFFGGDRTGGLSFLASVGILLAVVALLLLLSKGAKRGFYAKEGLVCVGLAWFGISLFGAFPFVISGSIPNFIDALFETVSGFTTTGASILSNVEALSDGMMYWRCFTHWLGGMGVLVFLLAVAPIGGQSEGFTIHLLRAESPGPNVGKLVPRIRRTAIILYLIYVVLTVLDFLFLLFGGMRGIDALCTAFATAGTGGFGIKNDSLMSFSPYIQNVCTVFMLLFGVNFNCYYLLLLGRLKSIFKDEEFRLYWLVFLTATGLITWNIFNLCASFWDSLRLSSFQVASIMTTTGFSTANFNEWPAFSKTILLLLMAIGACAGSTGGGFKCARIILLWKSMKRHIGQMMHPQSVKVIRVNGENADEKVLLGTNAYLVTYILCLVLSFLVISADAFVTSTTTSFTAVLSCLNNIGPGLDQIGPIDNYGGFSVFSKLVLILDMLAGRLELFPILVFLNKSTWKK